MKKSLCLTQLVLTSSLFCIPCAFADTTISTVVNTTQSTTVTGNIEISPTGSIQPPANNDGIDVNSASASVIVDANNVNPMSPPNAILTSGTGIGINVMTGGNNASIMINSGSNVNASTGTGDAIQIGNTATTLTNSGQILGGDSAIHLLNTGTAANITNLGGNIQGTNAASILIDAGGGGLTLTNSPSMSTPAVQGTIQALNAQDAIQINGDFNSITNSAGGTISAVNASAINVQSAATGDIQNFGTLSDTGGGPTVIINGAYNGSITNNSGGIIQNTANGQAVNLGNSFSSLNNNAGATISSNTAPSIIIFNAPGTINNAGTIQSTTATSTILIEGTSTGINNSGVIIANNPTVATISANGSAFKAALTNGIVNTGTITSGNGNPAIDLYSTAGANGIDVPLFQEGGTINGNVLLSYDGGTVLTMTGGTIVGDVRSSTANASTLNFNGGTVTGTVTVNAAGNVVNLAGSDLQTIQSSVGNNVYNITGGTFTHLIGMAGDTANINSTYTLTGTIANVPTINVNNSGTVFTADNTISGISTQLLINSGTTMIANAGPAGVMGTGTLTIQNGGELQINNGSSVDMGTATNSGYLAIANNASLNTTTTYAQSGAFAPTIQDMTPTGFGVIHVGTTATFNPGATLNPQLGTGTFVLNNFVFPVVQTATPVIGFNNITVVQPPSAILSFTKENTPNNIVELVAQTIPLSLVAEPDIPLAVAATLDALTPTTLGQIATTNPEILALLGQLQLLPDVQTVSNALLQLAPPFNYALPTSSRISMDNAFESVHARLESMTKIGLLTEDENYQERRDYELYNGVNYGDRNVVALGSEVFGAWIKAYGSILDQHKRHYIEGFKSDATGFAIGGDWHFTDYATIGVGQSYTKVNTTDYSDQQNTVNVKSNQTTFYGWFVPYEACQENIKQTIYIEMMLALATHKYDTTRNIAIGTLTQSAMASFYGWHYGAQADIGYAFVSSDNYLVAPLARFRFTYLDIGDYTETGAGGLSLNVKNDDIDETIAGAGIRLAWVKDFIQAVYVPEASVVLLYDFSGQTQEMQSNFLAGGNPFYTNSIKPAQYIQQYSLGITAYTSDGYVFTIKGNFEHRDHFFGYNGYMQLYYQWD